MEFKEIVDAVWRSVDSSRRLPDWPFRASRGFLAIYEYDRVLGGQFGRVLESLAVDFGDREVYVLGVAPEASYYLDGYEMFPAFRVGRGSLGVSYAAGLRHEPDGDPTGGGLETRSMSSRWLGRRVPGRSGRSETGRSGCY